jgi:hypothetical protein
LPSVVDVCHGGALKVWLSVRVSEGYICGRSVEHSLDSGCSVVGRAQRLLRREFVDERDERV